MPSLTVIRRIVLFFAIFLLVAEDFVTANRATFYEALWSLDEWWSSATKGDPILVSDDPLEPPRLATSVEVVWTGAKTNVNRIVFRLRNLLASIPVLKHIMLHGETGKIEKPFFALSAALTAELDRRTKSTKFKADAPEVFDETRVPLFLPNPADMALTPPAANPAVPPAIPIPAMIAEAKARGIPHPANPSNAASGNPANGPVSAPDEVSSDAKEEVPASSSRKRGRKKSKKKKKKRKKKVWGLLPDEYSEYHLESLAFRRGARPW